MIEIQSRILQYVVSVKHPRAITPHVTICNWNRAWRARCYEEADDPMGSLAFFPKQDEHGPYTEVCEVKRPAIDATALRVNKHFFATGNKMLYSKNTFDFYLPIGNHYHSPSSTYDGKRRHRPNPEKPYFDNFEDLTNDRIFTRGIRSIQEQVPEQKLPGWIYYDSFLRFLHNIGPTNASYIKSLKFRGIAILHTCPADDNCEDCEQNLVSNLRVYIPFFKIFCPNLRKLFITVWPDIHQDAGQNGNPATSEEAMLPLLENELRTITSLNGLIVEEIVDGDEDHEFLSKSAYWATETSQFIAKQSVERIKKERIEEGQRLKLQAEATEAAILKVVPKLSCEFCGENHIWPECHNLCPVCGEFGHKRKTCPHWKIRNSRQS